ncbi:MAG: hypothetical protein IPI15_18345 [Saprospiraceae bacterium]|nr:hypothetical protein [Candidatus Brachybacter algidus]
MFIVVEECDETQFWLELLFECKFINQLSYQSVYREMFRNT